MHGDDQAPLVRHGAVHLRDAEEARAVVAPTDEHLASQGGGSVATALVEHAGGWVPTGRVVVVVLHLQQGESQSSVHRGPAAHGGPHGVRFQRAACVCAGSDAHFPPWRTCSRVHRERSPTRTPSVLRLRKQKRCPRMHCYAVTEVGGELGLLKSVQSAALTDAMDLPLDGG